MKFRFKAFDDPTDGYCQSGHCGKYDEWQKVTYVHHRKTTGEYYCDECIKQLRCFWCNGELDRESEILEFVGQTDNWGHALCRCCSIVVNQSWDLLDHFKQRISELESELLEARNDFKAIRDKKFDEWYDKKYARKENRSEWIYFVTDGESIKIGTTRDVSKRIKALSTSSPRELRLLGIMPGGTEKERELHEKFGRYRIKLEWFQPAQEIIDFIDDICKKVAA